MTSSLVGSEMCIRDSRIHSIAPAPDRQLIDLCRKYAARARARRGKVSVSYTHLTLPTICSV
eukprot:5145108-Prorocentrum_lima.AAC.1